MILDRLVQLSSVRYIETDFTNAKRSLFDERFQNIERTRIAFATQNVTRINGYYCTFCKQIVASKCTGDEIVKLNLLSTRCAVYQLDGELALCVAFVHEALSITEVQHVVVKADVLNTTVSVSLQSLLKLFVGDLHISKNTFCHFDKSFS